MNVDPKFILTVRGYYNLSIVGLTLANTSTDQNLGFFFGPIYRYLVYGIAPGSFFTSLLANDLVGALSKADGTHTIANLKDMCEWLTLYMPDDAWGSYEVVEQWQHLSDDQRRDILVQANLVSSVWEILNT